MPLHNTNVGYKYGMPTKNGLTSGINPIKGFICKSSSGSSGIGRANNDSQSLVPVRRGSGSLASAPTRPVSNPPALVPVSPNNASQPSASSRPANNSQSLVPVRPRSASPSTSIRPIRDRSPLTRLVDRVTGSQSAAPVAPTAPTSTAVATTAATTTLNEVVQYERPYAKYVYTGDPSTNIIIDNCSFANIDSLVQHENYSHIERFWGGVLIAKNLLSDHLIINHPADFLR